MALQIFRKVCTAYNTYISNHHLICLISLLSRRQTSPQTAFTFTVLVRTYSQIHTSRQLPRAELQLLGRINPILVRKRNQRDDRALPAPPMQRDKHFETLVELQGVPTRVERECFGAGIAVGEFLEVTARGADGVGGGVEGYVGPCYCGC